MYTSVLPIKNSRDAFVYFFQNTYVLCLTTNKKVILWLCYTTASGPWLQCLILLTFFKRLEQNILTWISTNTGAPVLISKVWIQLNRHCFSHYFSNPVHVLFYSPVLLLKPLRPAALFCHPLLPVVCCIFPPTTLPTWQQWLHETTWQINKSPCTPLSTCISLSLCFYNLSVWFFILRKIDKTSLILPRFVVLRHTCFC